MENLIFSIYAVAPILLMVLAGYTLKRLGLADAKFAAVANKLVFHVFLPAMLFLNIYNMDDIGEVDRAFVFYAVIALVAIFAVSIPLVILVTPENKRRGVLLQATFRSNYSLIGLPLVQSIYGEMALGEATLLAAVAILTVNTLAIISLSMFSGNKADIRKILATVIKNPLIHGVVLGIAAVCLRMVFVHAGIDFRLRDITPVFKTVEYLAGLATPLALLMLGVQFNVSSAPKLRREILFGTLMRTAIAPLLGIGVAYLCFRSHFDGTHFASFIALFATPAAVAGVPMAQEMGGDAELAGQLVVWTTPFSAITMFLAIFLLRSAGIF